MRAPFGSESTDLCPDEKDILDSKKENEIRAIAKSLDKSRINSSAVFGICVEDLMETSPQVVPQIPFILYRICNFIEIYGLHQRSIFLDGDEKSLVKTLREEFAKSGDASLERVGHVASVAKLLIVFLEELPEPLIPVSSQSDFIQDIKKLPLNVSDCLSSLKISLEKLPGATYQVLKYLSCFLKRVAFHEEYNGMGASNLAVIFGPLIFRPTSDDKKIIISFQDITNCFVKDYHTIFKKDNELTFGESVSIHSVPRTSKNYRKKHNPPSLLPLMSPLTVVIPGFEETSIIENEKKNIPVLLIEGKMNAFFKNNKAAAVFKGDKNSLNQLDVVVTRKRKERRFSGEDSQQRSSSEERPPNSLAATDSVDILRRCSSHEEVTEAFKQNEASSLSPKTKDKTHSQLNDSSDMTSFSNLSPHPPTAKRREIEVYPEENSHAWEPSKVTNDCCDKTAPVSKDQNSIAELTNENSMDCDTLEGEDVSKNDFKFLDMPSIPRSASFPLPKSESSSNESENKHLSLSLSMLFENSEPVRAESHFNISKEDDDEESLRSPSVQNLRKSNYYEAPLSPSAFRSYLSYRNTHLDPSVPPSPPVEQEDFVKKLPDTNKTSESIKQLAKKIHSIKKRIRKYEDKFEAEFGFKPSHAEKSINQEARKLMNDLYKARKELKVLKEESHLEHVGSWHAAEYSHILEDTTNHDTIRPKVDDFFGFTMKTLADERKSANRPESFEEMTDNQVIDEKLALQKALLNLEEKINGKPNTKEQKDACRPLYNRYRHAKRLLVRSGSFPAAKTKDMCSDLQPILEHETMDFSSLAQNPLSVKQNSELKKPISTVEITSPEKVCVKEELDASNYFAMKYDNSNLHELPLSEMIFQMQKIKSDKRHLRKIIKDFETEFLKLNGRKTQKEDKSTIESVYSEYKHVKARLRLLEALISKHDQHQLM